MREMTLEEMAMVTGGAYQVVDTIVVTAKKYEPSGSMMAESKGPSAQDMANLRMEEVAVLVDDEIIVHAPQKTYWQQLLHQYAQTGSFICVNAAFGVAGSVCYDSNGHLYVAGGVGTPDLSVTFGASNNLNGVLTGVSANFSSEGAAVSVAPGQPSSGTSSATSGGVSVGLKPGAAASVTVGTQVF
jgi:hypothetical protein